MPPSRTARVRGPSSPDRLAALEQPAAGEVGGGQVVVAGDRVQRQAQPVRHVGDEAGLAAAGRALEQQRQAVAPGELEQLPLACPAAGSTGPPA